MIEDTLTLWVASLRDAKRRIRPLFTQDRVAASAGHFLDALLGNEPRKTGWMRAEAAGSAGKIANCQIGVFAAYVSGKGHAFIDRALYLPKAWTSRSPGWRPMVSMAWANARRRCVALARATCRVVNADHRFGSWNADRPVAGEAKDIAETLPAAPWQLLSAGHGTKGERLYDGAEACQRFRPA